MFKFKKALTAAVLTSSALAATMGYALPPGPYVSGGIGGGITNLKKNVFEDATVKFDPAPATTEIKNTLNKAEISDYGLAGRLGLGWLLTENFAVEAGFAGIWTKGTKVPEKAKDKTTKEVSKPAITFMGTHVFDLAAKGILPIGGDDPASGSGGFNLFAKFGVAYICHFGQKSNLTYGTGDTAGTVTGDLIANKIAPEVSLGASYDINPNLSIELTATHIFSTLLGKENKELEIDTANKKIKTSLSPSNVTYGTLGLVWGFC